MNSACLVVLINYFVFIESRHLLFKGGRFKRQNSDYAEYLNPPINAPRLPSGIIASRAISSADTGSDSNGGFGGIGTSSGTGINLGGTNLAGIGSGTNVGLGSNGVGTSSGTGVNLLGSNVAGTSSGTNVGLGSDGIGVGQGTGVNLGGTNVANVGSGTNVGFNNGGLGVGSGTSVGAGPVGVGTGTNVGLGSNGLGVGQGTGINLGGTNVANANTGTNVGFQNGGLGVGSGTNVGAGPVGVSSGNNVGLGPQGLGIGSGNTNVDVGGVPVAQAGTQTNIGPQFGTNPPGSPFGPVNAGIGLRNSSGVVVLGSGYTNGTNVQAGWPNGVNVNQGYDIYGVGNRWVSQRDGFYLKPQALTDYDFGTANGVRAWNSGYQKEVDGNAGINGYNLVDRATVPVLGQRVVDQANVSGFDLSRMTFGSGTVGNYGPINLATQGTSFSSPFLGDLVQRAMWNGVLQNAGLPGTPGGVFPGVPNIPFVGKRKKRENAWNKWNEIKRKWKFYSAQNAQKRRVLFYHQ